MKGFSLKRIALKVDVLQDRKIILFAGASVRLRALGTGAQEGHLDFHTAPELCGLTDAAFEFNVGGAGIAQWLERRTRD